MIVVANQQQPDKPRLTVVGSAKPAKTDGWQALIDGTAETTIGGIIAGGFGVETVKSFVTGETVGRWWFTGGLAMGIALVGLGLWLRTRARRRVRVGIVVTATDDRRGRERAQQLEQQAETFSRSTCTLTLKTSINLPADRQWDRQLVEALADETLSAITIAERLTPDATRINLVPTMPLHVAFWFGARLGHTHAREVAVHAIRQASGHPPYFPATCLRAMDNATEPLTIDRPETVDGGDPTVVALALDLQGRGDLFFDHVRAACQQHNVGVLLGLRGKSQSPRLPENQDTFTAVVEQTCRAWQDATLSADARTGRHMIFLSGPVAIAVALGARLAAPNHGAWTAFTFDGTTNTYEPFPTPARA